MQATTIDILDDGGAVRLGWSNGTSARFHAFWLRDNALDAATRSPGNGQRLISVLDLPATTKVSRADLAGSELHLTFVPEGHETVFAADWLWARRYDVERSEQSGWVSAELELWNCDLQGRVPTGSYARISADRAALGHWLAATKRFGFATLSEVPVTSGSLCEVAELFGFVRETNYGRFFEVRAEINPSNLAYTNLGLQAHTDNPYRDPVPTLQLLACLENSVEGGDSVVVDGFSVARKLQLETPRSFDLLARNPARFAYAGQNGVQLNSKRPVIELGPDGELLAIRFNNRSAAPLADVPYDDMPDYYAAYRRFAELVEEPQMAVTFKLAPGELFIVDNTRVLHARKAFSGSGQRWLQGCYADKDGLLSTLAASRSDEQLEAA
jgi:gamma-butyrobetaine dioxygenase